MRRAACLLVRLPASQSCQLDALLSLAVRDVSGRRLFSVPASAPSRSDAAPPPPRRPSPAVGREAASPAPPDADEPRARSLNAQLLRTEDARSLLATVAAHAPSLSAVNVSTAWHRLAVTLRSAPLPAAPPGGGGFGAAFLREYGDVIGPLEAATEHLLPSFGVQSATNTLWALGALCHVPSSGGRSASQPAPCPLLDGLLARAHTLLPLCDARCLSNMSWAAATLRGAEGARLPGGTRAALARLTAECVAFSAKLHERREPFAPQALTTLLWAAAACGISPGKGLADRVARAVVLSPHPPPLRAPAAPPAAWNRARSPHHFTAQGAWVYHNLFCIVNFSRISLTRLPSLITQGCRTARGRGRGCATTRGGKRWPCSDRASRPTCRSTRCRA